MDYMHDLKTCTQCQVEKEKEAHFYKCNGKFRSECKVCTIKRNSEYQKTSKTWRAKHRSSVSRRNYMRAYYATNKEKYSRYRKEFKTRNPDYYKKYFQRHPRKKNAKLLHLAS